GFATAPGETAEDGAGQHSPFTMALLKQLPSPGVEIQQVLTRVKADVYAATKGGQEPWHNSNLRFEFFLNPAIAPRPSSGETALSPDEELWRQLAGSDDRAAVELFVRAYPASPRIKEAEAKLAALSKDGKFNTMYSGELQPPEAKTYFSIKYNTVTR